MQLYRSSKIRSSSYQQKRAAALKFRLNRRNCLKLRLRQRIVVEQRLLFLVVRILSRYRAKLVELFVYPTDFSTKTDQLVIKCLLFWCNFLNIL